MWPKELILICTFGCIFVMSMRTVFSPFDCCRRVDQFRQQRMKKPQEKKKTLLSVQSCSRFSAPCQTWLCSFEIAMKRTFASISLHFKLSVCMTFRQSHSPLRNAFALVPIQESVAKATVTGRWKDVKKLTKTKHKIKTKKPKKASEEKVKSYAPAAISRWEVIMLYWQQINEC